MYDDIAASYNALHSAEQRRKFSLLSHYIDFDAIKTVLDVGCGTAHLASYFDGLEYVGVDPSAPLLEQARAGTLTVCARGEELPFADETFDLVLSMTALHNYDNPVVGVQELFRVAKSLVLVGVLKKSAVHDTIVCALQEQFRVEQTINDQHDTLLVCHKV